MVVAASLVIVSTIVVSSSALAYVQGGRRTAVNSTLNGSSMGITAMTAFYPDNGNCVLQASVVYDGVNFRQLLVGLLRCQGATVDGTCQSGVKFVERWYNGSFFCYPHGGFANGTEITVSLNRSGVQTDTFIPYINGVGYNTQGGFSTGATAVQAFAFGERTPGSSCNGTWGNGLRMRFRNWQRLTNDYAYVSGDLHTNPANNTCWNVSNATSTGDFNVTR